MAQSTSLMNLVQQQQQQQQQPQVFQKQLQVIQRCGYSDLQKIASKVKIPANLKGPVMRQRLQEHHLNCYHMKYLQRAYIDFNDDDDDDDERWQKES